MLKFGEKIRFFVLKNGKKVEISEVKYLFCNGNSANEICLCDENEKYLGLAYAKDYGKKWEVEYV